MTTKSYIITALVALTATVCSGCGDSEPGGGKTDSGTYRLAGKVEKGPFVRGSAINVHPLDASLNAIGTVFNCEIKSDAGNFDAGSVELPSQFVRITADGYFFNEVSGLLSDGMLRLTAYADLTDRSSVNVNILTHLKSARIQKLMQTDNSFAKADRQAQAELLSQFGLQAYKDIPAEEMSIAAGTDGSGVLIAISSLLLVDRTEADVTQLLSSLSQDLADDGKFTDENIQLIANSRYKLTDRLDDIARHIVERYADLGQTVAVPDLRYFFDWNGDGVAGNELVDNPQVALSATEVSFDKNGGTTTIQVTSNIPLTLEPFAGTDQPANPDIIVEGHYRDFFESQPESIRCTSSYANNVLTIIVDKSQRRCSQTTTVTLYDAMGKERASVKVDLAGDPSVKLPELSQAGRNIVSKCVEQTATALSYMFYMERGYTGMYPYYDVICPLKPTDQLNQKAFRAAYTAININTYAADNLYISGLKEAVPFFRLLNAVLYTEMADKWGNIGVLEHMNENDIKQQTPDNVLHYIENMLDELALEFAESGGIYGSSSVDEVFRMSADVWHMAKASVCMALGKPDEAKVLLQDIIDSRRYTVPTGNDYDANSGTILQIKVPDEVMHGHMIGYYTYTDVLLLQAECNLAAGNTSEAVSAVRKVAEAKNTKLSGDITADIAALRKQQFLPRYFAFQKRNSLGDYLDYQKLWPLPANEIVLSGWTQNPGY